MAQRPQGQGFHLGTGMAGTNNYGGFVTTQVVNQYVQPNVPPPPYPGIQPGPVPGNTTGHNPLMRPPVFPMQMPARPSGINPPMYTPQLAINYQAKQRMNATQLITSVGSNPPKMTSRKEMEIQQQKQQLKNFNKRGPVDADKLIESMFGKSEKVSKNIPPSSDVPVDPFGDFMQAPVARPKPTENEDRNSEMDITPVTLNPVHKEVLKQTQEPKPDLMAKMLECSDFSMDKKGKTFHHPKLSEIRSVQSDAGPTVPVFHESQRARHWSGSIEEETLSDLFQSEPQPIAAKKQQPHAVTHAAKSRPAPLIMPGWCKSEDRVPQLYRQVLEASLVDGKIVTERLYPILLLSGLSREVLGKIWSMANQLTAGYLTRPELFLLLGYVALAQNNVNQVSLEMLMRYPQPPLPFLGQANDPAYSPQIPSAPTGIKVAMAVPDPNILVVSETQEMPTPVPTAQATPQPQENFADFQGKTENDDQKMFMNSVLNSHNIPQKPGYLISVPKPDDAKLAAELSPDMTYSNVRNFFGSDDSSATTDDDFDDFKSADSKHSDSTSQLSTSEQSESEDFKSFENYLDDFSKKKEEIEKRDHKPKHKFTAATPPKISPLVHPTTNIPKIPQPSPGTGEIIEQVAPKPSPSPAPAVATLSIPPLPVVHKLRDPVKSKTEYHRSSTEPDFADFQSAFPASSTVTHAASSNNVRIQTERDKYAAFRSLNSEVDLMDMCAFTEVTPTEDKTTPQEAVKSSIVNNDDGDWANFQTAFQPDTPAGSGSSLGANNGADNDKSDRIFQESTNDSKMMNFEHSKQVTEPLAEIENSDWSDFSSRLNIKSEKQHTIDFPFPNPKTEPSLNCADENTNEWADFQKSEQTSSSLVVIKKENLQKNEILNLFKVDHEPKIIPAISNDNFVSSDEHTKINIPSPYEVKREEIVQPKTVSHAADKRHNLSSTSVDTEEDLFRAPPPMDDFEEEDEDFGAFSRGYDHDDDDIMVAQTSWESDEKKLYGIYSIKSEAPSEHKEPKSEIESSFAVPSETCDILTVTGKETGSACDKSKFNIQAEDSQSVSSLDLPYNPKGHIPNLGEQADTQSVSSAEFGMFEHSNQNPESKSLDSLDLRKVEDSTMSESASSDSLDIKTGDDTEVVEATQEFQDENIMPQDGGIQDNLNDSEIVEPASTPDIAPVPLMGDRYSEILQDIPGRDRHAYEWERGLDNCHRMIRDANDIFNSVTSSTVCNELIRSSQGIEYVQGIIEIYRVVCRITVSLSVQPLGNDKLDKLLKDIDLAWNNLTAFLAGCSVMPDPSLLDFFHAKLKTDDAAAQMKACGVCLLNTECASRSFSLEENRAKLTYGGRNYHAPCANFWINCVDSRLPSLSLPKLIEN